MSASRTPARDWQDRLQRSFAEFPGIATGPRGSRVTASATGIEATFAFEDGVDGRTAELLVAYLMQRAEATAGDEAEGDAAPARYHVAAERVARFARGLDYASARILAPAHTQRQLAEPTLPALLSHALVAFTCDYATLADNARIPSLPVWSNILRVIDAGGTESRDIADRAIVSRRTIRMTLAALQRIGWLRVDGATAGRRRKSVHLTAAGRTFEAAARKRIDAVEEAWRERFGAPRIDGLRRALTAIADDLELALPWYLTGYGLGDASLTGGSYLPAEPGPPRIPARGQEWPVVVRTGTHAAVPLPALLSQVLAAFTLDYEGEQLGSLAWASMFLRFVPDEGLPLAQARTLGGVVGNGKCGPERHLCVAVEPAKPSDGTRMVYLAPKSKRARDAYPALVSDIEERWRSRFGAAALGLRETLADMEAEWDPDTADYPDTTTWLHGHLMRANWMLSDPTQRPGNLPWHGGQRSKARPA